MDCRHGLCHALLRPYSRTADPLMSDLPITARSFVNAWQCDENDHLNVQFYTGYADEASPHLHAMLGSEPGPRIAVAEDYIRYHREMRTADSVEVRSAPVAIDDSSLTAYHEIRNADDGEIAATVRRTTRFIDTDGEPLTWGKAFREQALAHRVALPDIAKPRTTGTRGEIPALTAADPRAAQLVEIGRGTVQARECNGHGRMTPQAHFGRFSDGAGFLWRSIGFNRPTLRRHNQGTAVLELLCRYYHAPHAGDLIVVRSGLLASTDRILHIVHFMFDGPSGKLLAQAEGVGVLFDLEARKIARISAEDQLRLEGRHLQL